MDTDPALHPQALEHTSDMAPDSPTGEGVPAGQVNGVESEPCGPEFDLDERREYGGISARYLAIYAVSLLKRRISEGFGDMIHHLCKESRPVEHAIYIYTRVKAAMRKLTEPVSVDIVVTDKGTYVPRYPLPPCDRVEDKDPSISHTEWKVIGQRQGFDVRGTSMVWVERRVAKARANARRMAKRQFVKSEGLVRARQTQQMLSEMAQQLKRQNAHNAAFAKRVKDDPELIHEKLEPIAPTYGEIYPPVPMPDRSSVPVTVNAVPAVAPKPTIDEVNPIVGVEHAYCEFNARNTEYVRDSLTGWQLPVFIDPEKPP